jgi:hypothetical protein
MAAYVLPSLHGRAFHQGVTLSSSRAVHATE